MIWSHSYLLDPGCKEIEVYPLGNPAYVARPFMMGRASAAPVDPICILVISDKEARPGKQ
jgi:hypothetical protein